MERRGNGLKWIAAVLVLASVAVVPPGALRAAEYMGAVLEERQGQTLYFTYVENRKIFRTYGRLTDRTKVLDPDGSSLSEQAVQAGSAWNLEFRDTGQGQEAPEIEEMVRIQPAPTR
jgi:hypothetical protein